jgi:hypothetical protein
MNLAQMRTQLRELLTAGGGRNTAVGTDDFWSEYEYVSYLNMAQQEIYKIIRRARGDYFTRILRSTDSPLVIRGQTFTPSSLRWVQGQGNYQLPADFVRMKLITDLSEDRVRLVGSDIARNEFKVLMNLSGGNTAREFLYDILGVRTLVIRPLPDVVRDFEFIYEKSLDPMRIWETGSVDVTNGNTTVTFSGSADIQNRLQVGDELIPGTTSSTQTMPDPDATYPVIQSIDSATQVTLASPWLGATGTGLAYRVASVSEIPVHHHYLLVIKAAVYAFKKGTNPSLDSAASWQAEFDSMVPSLVNDVETRQGSDIETTVPFMEDLYDV